MPDCSTNENIFRKAILSKMRWLDNYWLFGGIECVIKSLYTIEFISVPRPYYYHSTNDPVVMTELHGFCDVSIKANRCCVYLRFAHRTKFVKVVFVTSKPWIVPLYKQSIRKLELLSFLLLVCLINTLKNEFKSFMIFWTSIYEQTLLLHTPGLWTQVRFFLF